MVYGKSFCAPALRKNRGGHCEANREHRRLRIESEHGRGNLPGPHFQLTLILYTTRAAMRRAKIVPNDQAKLSAALSDLVRMKLDRHSRTPFYRQVYERISQAIRDGSLHPANACPPRAASRAASPRRGERSTWLTAFFRATGTSLREAPAERSSLSTRAPRRKIRSKPALPRKLRLGRNRRNHSRGALHHGVSGFRCVSAKALVAPYDPPRAVIASPSIKRPARRISPAP